MRAPAIDGGVDDEFTPLIFGSNLISYHITVNGLPTGGVIPRE
jgi:hypothetical protein